MVSPYDIATPGGVNNHIEHLARELRKLGHAVTRFAPAAGVLVESDPDFVPIGRPVAVPASGSRARVSLSPFLGNQVRRALAEGAFDLLHIHEPLTPALPIHFLRQSRSVTVGTFHAAYEQGNPRYALFRPILQRWDRLLDRRTAVSPPAARLVERYFGGSYELIPNGVDIATFARPAPRPPNVPTGPYILFVSRLEARKGLHVLLRAFARLREAHDDVALVIVGDGPRRAAYERWVSEKHLGGVHFIGEVANAQLPAFYQHATIYCAPHVGNESFGIVLIEAMAAGAPVVASDIEAFDWLLAHGTYGLLARAGDPVALSAALRRLLASAEERSALAALAAGLVRAFDWPTVAQRYHSLFEDAVAEHGRVRRSAIAR